MVLLSKTERLFNQGNLDGISNSYRYKLKSIIKKKLSFLHADLSLTSNSSFSYLTKNGKIVTNEELESLQNNLTKNSKNDNPTIQSSSFNLTKNGKPYEKNRGGTKSNFNDLTKNNKIQEDEYRDYLTKFGKTLIDQKESEINISNNINHQFAEINTKKFAEKIRRMGPGLMYVAFGTNLRFNNKRFS